MNSQHPRVCRLLVRRPSKSRAGIRSIKRGFTFLEVMISAATGSMLVVGLGATLFLMTRGASETSRSQLLFNVRAKVAQFEREIADAHRIEQNADGTLSLHRRTPGAVADDPTITYSWNSDRQVLIRTEGSQNEVYFTDVAKYEATLISNPITRLAIPKSLIGASQALMTLGGSENTLNVSNGTLVVQPLILPATTSRSGAVRAGSLIDSIVIAISKRSSSGTISVRLVRLDSAGAPVDDPLASWDLVESTLSGSSVTLTPAHPLFLVAGGSYAMLITPKDANGDFKFGVVNSSPLLSTAPVSTRVFTAGTTSVALTVTGRAVDRLGTWSESTRVPVSLGYTLGISGTLNEAHVGTISLSSRRRLSDRDWVFDGRQWRQGSLSSDASNISSNDQSLLDWTLSGTCGNEINGVRIVRGTLTATPDVAAVNNVIARIRVASVTGTDPVTWRVGVGNQVGKGFQIEVLWENPAAVSSELEFYAVKGTSRVGLARVPVNNRLPFEIDLLASPNSVTVSGRVDGVNRFCADLSESGLPTAAASTGAIHGMSLSTGTTQLGLDLMTLEHGGEE